MAAAISAEQMAFLQKVCHVALSVHSSAFLLGHDCIILMVPPTHSQWSSDMDEVTISIATDNSQLT